MGTWIPVSEGDPVKVGYYLVTVEIEAVYEKPHSFVTRRGWGGREWITDARGERVTAWDFLPAPYQSPGARP